jgi:uncharacterized protein (TIGR01619 family)
MVPGAKAMDWKGWKPYLCNVNSKPASIFVNLDLIGSAPISSKTWLLWTWVYFKSPRPDGLSDSAEAPKLYEIEDALIACVTEACNAMPCGRITTEGRREFYFYGETKRGFHRAASKAMSGFEGYSFDLGEQADPRWEQYLNVLYPSLESLQRISNMDLLDVLVKQGDVLTVAREVDHWILFGSESSRSLFRSAANAAGFTIADESKVESEPTFVIKVTRKQPIDQNSIDKTVIELLNLSRKFGGDYDGWETPVVTQ